MDEYVRLKTPNERRKDIERELDFLEHQKQAAKREYERKIAEIEAQRARQMKRLRRLAIKEAKQR